MPSIAINTPSLNHERYVRSFIESVAAQNCPGVRLCVVDDASEDGNFTKLTQLQNIYEFKLLRNDRRLGIVPTLRIAYETNGPADYYLAIASDDLLAPRFVQSVYTYFEAHPDVDVIIGNVVFINPEGRQIGRLDAEADGRVDLVKWAKGEQKLMPNWMVYRHRVMELERPYEADLALDDLPVFIRIVAKYNVRVAGFDFISYRKHPDSHSNSRAMDVYLAEKKVLEPFRGQPFYHHYMRQARINWFLNFSGKHKKEAARILLGLGIDLWRWRVIKGIVRLFFYFPKK
jgi:glycosyltransferase involved in cell wall biosynthesis